MNTGGNPYSGLLQLIRNQGGDAGAPGWEIGVVTSASPLKIVYRGVTLEAGQIFGAAGLTLSAGKRVAILPHASSSLFVILAAEGA